MHSFAARQSIPSNPASALTAGVGIGWTVQVCPSQFSASQSAPPNPTTVHCVAEMQETLLGYQPGIGGRRPVVQLDPLRLSANAPEDQTAAHHLTVGHDTLLMALPANGLSREIGGVPAILHVVPFRSSTPGTPLALSPTAVHDVIAGHDTASKLTPLAAVSECHVEPSQRSANPSPAAPLPTAVHAVADRHDTPENSYADELAVG